MRCLHNSFIFCTLLTSCIFCTRQGQKKPFCVIERLITFPFSDPGVTMTISGGSIQHFLVGQGVSLVCRVQGPGLTSPPLALYWERGNKVSDCERVIEGM